MIAAYLSIGPYDRLEQDILFDSPLREFLVTTALKRVARVNHAPCQAILKGSLPDIIASDVPELLIEFGERKAAELVSLQKHQDLIDDMDDDDWIVVLRPGQGYLGIKRIEHFWNELKEQDINHRHVVSTVPLQINFNPLWQTTFFDRKLQVDYGFCKPVCGEWAFKNIYTIFPELDSVLPRRQNFDIGSQHITQLQKNDQAIYALRRSELPSNCDEKLLVPIPLVFDYGDHEDSGEKFLYDLFLLDQQQKIDTRQIYRLMQLLSEDYSYASTRHDRQKQSGIQKQCTES